MKCLTFISVIYPDLIVIQEVSYSKSNFQNINVSLKMNEILLVKPSTNVQKIST